MAWTVRRPEAVVTTMICWVGGRPAPCGFVITMVCCLLGGFLFTVTMLEGTVFIVVSTFWPLAETTHLHCRSSRARSPYLPPTSLSSTFLSPTAVVPPHVSTVIKILSFKLNIKYFWVQAFLKGLHICKYVLKIIVVCFQYSIIKVNPITSISVDWRTFYFMTKLFKEKQLNSVLLMKYKLNTFLQSSE